MGRLFFFGKIDDFSFSHVSCELHKARRGVGFFSAWYLAMPKDTRLGLLDMLSAIFSDKIFPEVAPSLLF